MKKSMDELLARAANRKVVADFPSESEFKARFWREAESQPRHSRRRLFIPLALAAAFLLLLGGVLLSLPLWSGGKSEVKNGWIAMDEKSTFQELAFLFGAETGVGLLNDEVFTFERQNRQEQSQLLEITVTRADREPLKLSLLVGGSDYLVIDTPQISGHILVCDSGSDQQIIENELEIRLPDGRKQQLNEVIVLQRGQRTVSESGLSLAAQCFKIDG